MEKNNIYDKVKTAMLCVQRLPWEQGVCAQALFEADETSTYIAMAYEAVSRQIEDGRLAMVGEPIAVTDPASNGEVVWRAYEHTGDEVFKTAAEKMLKYLMKDAPRTNTGLICHNTVSFEEGFSPKQIWVDSIYMLVPFLALMGELTEAQKQIDGYFEALSDLKTNRLGTGLLYHIYDAENEKYVRPKLWATGNAWALLGLARLITITDPAQSTSPDAAANAVVRMKYVQKSKKLLDAMLEKQCESGFFHDTLDDDTSFEDATSAMMVATFIYRGILEGWLEPEYLVKADKVYKAVQNKVDKFGIIRDVCGSPHFKTLGTSAEAQAAYIMMHTWSGSCNAGGEEVEEI
ncbi:MAG: glycoside hydrolase family 88 protein [Oscillospiraceae bacterium]|nr:glycoside hydrolase family 88 protein [Oscillospiraceae bacterium]